MLNFNNLPLAHILGERATVGMTADVIAQAYANYIDEIAANVSLLQGIITEASEQDTRGEASAMAVELLEENGFSFSATLALPEGTFRVLDLAVSAWDRLNDENPDPNMPNDESFGQLLLSTEDTKLLARALRAACLGSVADRISYISDFFSTDSKEVYADILCQNLPTSDTIKSLISEVIPITFPDETSKFADPGLLDSRLDDYAGHSPKLAFGFDASNFVEAIGQIPLTNFKIAKAIVSSVDDMLNFFSTSVRNKVTETISDPVDIKVVNEEGDGTIDRAALYYQGHKDVFWYLPMQQEQTGFGEQWDSLSASEKATILKKASGVRSYEYPWVFIDCDITFTEVTITDFGNAEDGWSTSFWLSCDMKWTARLRAIDSDVYNAPYFANTYTSAYLEQANYLAGLGSTAYVYDVSDNLAERKLYRSFGAARNLLRNLCDYIIGNETGYGVPSVPSSVTNRDFVNISCSEMRDATYTTPWMLMAFAQAIDKFLNPSDFAFIPYLRSVSIRPTFMVKSDLENDAAFTAAIAAAVAVIAVTTVGITVGLKLKKWKRARAFKNQSTIQELNAKMGRGEALTKAEEKRYIKATKRGGVSTLVGSQNGIPESPSSAPDQTMVQAIGERMFSNIWSSTE